MQDSDDESVPETSAATTIEKEPTDNKQYKFTQVAQLNSQLLTWYDANHRILPWRTNPKTSHVHGKGKNGEVSSRDDEPKSENSSVETIKAEDLNQRAYQVWISEIMSQQTRIATVLSYYKNWMKQFPTVDDLARASVDDVHAVWSGLGYYRRADNIHKAAKKVVTDMKGKFPTNTKDLLELPGVGRYTAGAIASIVFRERAPIVDGNVLRLFSRLQMIPFDISKQKNCNDYFWPLAQQLVSDVSVPNDRIGDLNQSLMEMGATVCTPKNPSCSECCIRDLCEAHESVQNGESVSVEIWPVKAKKKQKAIKFVAVCILYKNPDETFEDSPKEQQYYIMKNPSSGLLANLYQFPSITIEEDTADGVIEKSLQKYIMKNTDLDLSVFNASFEYCGQVQHIFTHIDMQLKVYAACLENSVETKTSKAKEIESAFVTLSGFDDYGIPTLVRKVFQRFVDKDNDVKSIKSVKKRSTPKKKPTLKPSTTKRRRSVAKQEDSDSEQPDEDEDEEKVDVQKRPRTRSQTKLTQFFIKPE